MGVVSYPYPRYWLRILVPVLAYKYFLRCFRGVFYFCYYALQLRSLYDFECKSRNQESGIRNQEIFIFNTTQQKHLDKLTVLVYKKTILHISGIKAICHDNQVEKNKTKQNKINLIGSCINRRNTQQNYVNSVMTNGNKPVMRHINAPVHNINTVRLTWVKSEKKDTGDGI